MKTLKVVRKTFTMLSEKRTEVLDITKQIRDLMLAGAGQAQVPGRTRAA